MWRRRLDQSVKLILCVEMNLRLKMDCQLVLNFRRFLAFDASKNEVKRLNAVSSSVFLESFWAF
jgi:hypothetical protein